MSRRDSETDFLSWPPARIDSETDYLSWAVLQDGLLDDFGQITCPGMDARADLGWFWMTSNHFWMDYLDNGIISWACFFVSAAQN